MATNTNAVPFLGYGRALPNVAVHTAIADANYTVLATDTIIGITSLTSTRTVTLPHASSVKAGKQLAIKDESGSCSSGNTITISGSIDGASSVVLNTSYAVIRLYSNGTTWSRIGA